MSKLKKRIVVVFLFIIGCIAFYFFILMAHLFVLNFFGIRVSILQSADLSVVNANFPTTTLIVQGHGDLNILFPGHDLGRSQFIFFRFLEGGVLFVEAAGFNLVFFLISGLAGAALFFIGFFAVKLGNRLNDSGYSEKQFQIFLAVSAVLPLISAICLLLLANSEFIEHIYILIFDVLLFLVGLAAFIKGISGLIALNKGLEKLKSEGDAEAGRWKCAYCDTVNPSFYKVCDRCKKSRNA